MNNSYGPPTKTPMSFSFVKWAEDSANQKAWKEIIDMSNGAVIENRFDDFEADFVIGNAIVTTRLGSLCMNKARRLG
jgi:hypothetical protein